MSESNQSGYETALPENFFNHHGNVRGSKALMRLENGLYLFYVRDFNTSKYPGTIDLIGGGAEGDETAYETLCRETSEEIGVAPLRSAIDYARDYPSEVELGKVAWFAHLDLGVDLLDLNIGDEGLELLQLSLEEYLSLQEELVYPLFQQRTRDYLEFISG